MFSSWPCSYCLDCLRRARRLADVALRLGPELRDVVVEVAAQHQLFQSPFTMVRR